MQLDNNLRRFLLKCIQSDCSDCKEEAVDFFNRHFKRSRNFEWAAIFHQGFRVSLPLYTENSSFARSLEPFPGVREQIKLRYVHNAAKNQEYIRTIKRLAQVFRAAGTEIVFLKGAGYLATIYADDPGVRVMADIDVLVKNQELEKAINILEKEGFRQNYERFSKEMGVTHTEEYFAHRHFHFIFYKDDVKLELHWNISFLPPRVVLEKIFDTLVTVRMGNTEIHIVSPEAALYMTCDNFQRDYGYIDLADCFLQRRIGHRSGATLFFLFEFKKLLAYYQDKISWDTFSFFCKECGNLFPMMTLLCYASSFTLSKLPEAALKKMNGIPGLGIYRFLLNHAHKNNFMKAFMLRNILLCLYSGRLFGKSSKSYLSRLVRSVTYYLSFENCIILSACKGVCWPIKSIKSALRPLFSFRQDAPGRH